MMTTSNEHNNAPAVPQGEPEAYMVYGNYTRQPFRSIESAQAYMGGLLKSDPEGGYHIRPLFYATPAAPSQEPAVPQGWRDFLTELSKQKPEKPDYWSSCGQCERNSSTAEDLIAATPAPAPAVPQGWTKADSDAARLALEIKCLLMDTKDLSVVSKWWGSANDALELHRQRLAATPAPAPAVPQGWTKAADQVPIEADGEVFIRFTDGSIGTGWATYWHGASNEFAQWTFPDPDEDRTVLEWTKNPATPSPAPAQGEPFGHFRAEPFGWTDCAKDDEGAIALYERPQEVGLTDEDVNAAAKVLAERFDYSWEHMPEEGRKNMRVQARAVVEAALRAKGRK